MTTRITLLSLWLALLLALLLRTDEPPTPPDKATARARRFATDEIPEIQVLDAGAIKRSA